MGRGGARAGAGRPSKLEKTKPIRVPVRMVGAILEFVAQEGYQYPFYSSKVSAGLPTPADDHIAEKLNLNELLIKEPVETFLVRVSGESMLNAGIHSGDILIVDKSLKPGHGKIVIATIDGQLTVKRLMNPNKNNFQLQAENDQFKPIFISEANDICILGVVTNVIHPV